MLQHYHLPITSALLIVFYPIQRIAESAKASSRGQTLAGVLLMIMIHGLTGCGNQKQVPQPNTATAAYYPPVWTNPRFNPRSGDETMRWIVSIGEEVRQANDTGNELIIKDARAKHNKALDDILNNEFHWTFIVKQVSDSAVYVFPFSSPRCDDEEELGKRFELSAALADPMQYACHFYFTNPFRAESMRLPFQDTDRQYVRTLVRGSQVTITGTFNRHELGLSGGYQDIWLYGTNCLLVNPTGKDSSPK